MVLASSVVGFFIAFDGVVHGFPFLLSHFLLFLSDRVVASYLVLDMH